MSRRLLKSTAVVGSMTMLSRLLGFARDIILARMFGAGIASDAFFVAFKIPNFMRRLFAEGAFSQAFVPVLSEYKSQREHAEVKQLVSDVTGTLGGFLFILTAVGVMAAPYIISVIGFGLADKPGAQPLASEMLRLTFPYLLFISLTALAGGVLNTYGRFAVPALTPVLLNLCLIGAAIWLAPLMDEPIVALAWGVFFAGLAQLLFQLPFVLRLKLLGWPRWAWQDSAIQRILKLMLPAIFASSVAQINLLFDTMLATALAAGSVSWLYYSDRLVEFPLGVFGIALATVILPSLSKNHAEKSTEEFSHTMDWALRWVFLIGTPATTGLLLLAGPMLTTLFQYGAFGPSDVEMARMSLMAYSIGLLGFILVKVLAPGYFSRQDTKTPMKIGIRAMGVNMIFNVIFVVPMMIYAIPGAHTGLAAATALSAFINAWMLYRGLRRSSVYLPGKGWLILFARVIAANGIMGLVIWFGSGSLSRWFEMSAAMRINELLLWVVLGVLSYFITLWISGVRKHDLIMKKSA
ncbi:MAG: murein biosynthesis integral membrane protein MurJ [Gammaproteobacteria bacterium]|nr:murein biosynthesis integral membrane protein MurJ [Gammaproteobacteria bacterium]